MVQNETLKEKIKIFEKRQKNFFCAKCGVHAPGYDRHAVLDGGPFRCSPLCFDDTHTLHYTRIRYHMFQHSTVCVLSKNVLRSFFCCEHRIGTLHNNGLDDLNRCYRCTLRCYACGETTEAVDVFEHCERCALRREEKHKVSVQFGSRTIVMDVTLGDSLHSLYERIKEAHKLTREAASTRIYDNRRRIIRITENRTILDHYWRDVFWNRVRNISSVIKLIVELEEE